MSTYPVMIPYSQALMFATDCTVGVEFIDTYGSAIRWIDSLIDMGELMAFIEDKLNGR